MQSTFLYRHFLLVILFQVVSVFGDTFIETFSTGRIKSYLNQEAQKPIPEHLQSFQLSNECYLFNVREFKHHNVTATYAKQKIVKKGEPGNVIEQPLSPRLFPTKETSTPIYSNVYVIPNIKTNTFHDLRLSYSSSTPAQFSMKVLNLSTFETYFPQHLNRCCKECQNLETKDTLILFIYADYDGVTMNEPNPNSLVIPYNIVFEPYLFYIIPRNVIPLLGFMAVIALGLIYVVIPQTFQHIHHIKQE